MSANKDLRISGKGIERGALDRVMKEFLKAYQTKSPESGENIVFEVRTPVFQKLDNVELLQEEIHRIKDKQEFDTTRIDGLEYRVNIARFLDRIEKIEEFMLKTFSDIANIKHASYSPTEEGLEIIVIHDFEDRVEALDKIQKCLFQIEDAFAGVYFEPTIMHISEVDSELLSNVKTVLQR